MSHTPMDTTTLYTIKKAAALDGETVTWDSTATGLTITASVTSAANISVTYGSGGIDSSYDTWELLDNSAYYTVSALVPETARAQKQAARVIGSQNFEIPASGATAQDVDLDSDAFFTFEWGKSKDWLLANFTSLSGSDLRAIAAPTGATPDVFIDWLNTNESNDEIGFYLSRGSKPAGEPAYEGSPYDFRNLNTKIILTLDWDAWAGGDVADYVAGTITDASIKARGAQIADWARTIGAVLMPYSHDTETEANAAMWTAFLQGVKLVDGSLLKDINAVITYIRSGTQDGSNLEVWAQDWGSGYSYDLKLNSTSDLIDTGVYNSNTYGVDDADGNPQYGAWDIGPYERQPTKAKTIWNFGGRNFGPQ